MKHFKPWMTLAIAVVAGLAASTSPAEASPDDATDSPSCTMRAILRFVQERNDYASASANGRTRPDAEDAGDELLSYVVGDSESQYIEEALAAGCTVEVWVTTRLTVSVHNDGSAWAVGAYSLDAPGSPVVTVTVPPARYPLEDKHCTGGGQCQKYYTNVIPITTQLPVGAVIELYGSSSANASAEEGSSANQATAAWDLRYASLYIERE